jgi:23S rRNA (uracil1939-C5)-methyltransferase
VAKSSGPRFINPARRGASAATSRVLFEARVQGLTDTGEAVVNHPDGRRFFVPGAWPGELVGVRPIEVKSQYGRGELAAVLEAAPERIESPCPHQGFTAERCGGCPWMMVNYTAQLAAKQARVERALARLQSDLQVAPILAAPQPLGYRVRAQLKTDGRELGFVAAGQHHLAPVQDCLVLTDHNRGTLRELRAQLPNSDWRPARQDNWTTLDLDESVSADSISINRRLPFQQANAAQNQAMRQWLADRVAPLSKQARVLELFAGSGNFTQVLATAGFNSITAAEVVQEAVTALAEQQLPGVSPVLCNLFDTAAFQRLLQDNGAAEILVLDPPRDGLKVREGLFGKRSRLREIFYISCDLATLCRDLQEMLTAGFVLIEAQPLDLFPQTPHVELMVHLRRRRP